MHQSIHAKSKASQPAPAATAVTTAQPTEQEPEKQDPTLFFHRGRMFPYSSPREEASRAKEEQAKSLQEMVGTSLEKARARRMEMEMEYMEMKRRWRWRWSREMERKEV